MPRAQSLFPLVLPCYFRPVCAINSRPDVCHSPSLVLHLLCPIPPSFYPSIRTSVWAAVYVDELVVVVMMRWDTREPFVFFPSPPTHLGDSSEWIKNSSCCGESVCV